MIVRPQGCGVVRVSDGLSILRVTTSRKQEVIHVTIQNSGGEPRRSVVLHVTGTSYNLGDIPPGATVQATIHPAEDSQLEIEFTDRALATHAVRGMTKHLKQWTPAGESPLHELLQIIRNAQGEFERQRWGPVRRIRNRDLLVMDEVSIRFYLKLSKDWGWSGQDFHPHLTHFLTTENSKWHEKPTPIGNGAERNLGNPPPPRKFGPHDARASLPTDGGGRRAKDHSGAEPPAP